MDDMLSLVSHNGTHDVTTVPDPVNVSISRGAVDHISAWSIDQRTLALHESSHLCLHAILGIPAASVSIKGGNSSGVTTSSVAEDDQPRLMLDSTVRKMIVIALGGLAAEFEFLGEGTVGNESDIQSATSLAISRLDNGLDPDYPIVALESFIYGSAPSYLKDVRGKLVVVELARARAEAEALVKEHREQILAFAKLLYRSRRIEGEALDAAIRAVGLTPAPRGAQSVL